jgi:LacI family transcriptional regulator
LTVTIRDVAKHAGVSIKTVSRVINNEAFVRDETRAKVLQAIDDLGYVVNVSAQRLASGRSYAIGLVYHDASWHYINHVLQSVLATGRKAGYNVILHPCDACRPNDCQDILHLVSQRSVDGFIFTPPSDNSATLLNELQASGVPFVRLTPRDRESPWPYVTTTDWQGACDMTQYLLSRGHRRIGFVTGPPEQKTGRDRFDGFRAALAEEGINADPTLVAQGDDHFDAGCSGASSLLNVRPRPTAIFANNDEMASGVLVAAHYMGISVPKELSVVGFDDIPLSRQVWPPLTTVRQPIRKMAELATNLLIRILEGEELDTYRFEVPTRLIIRESTGDANNHRVGRRENIGGK